MKKLGGVLFFVLAIAFGIGLFVAWETLGHYYMVFNGLQLPWFSARAFVALGAIGFAVRSAQLFHTPKAVPVQING